MRGATTLAMVRPAPRLSKALGVRRGLNDMISADTVPVGR